MSVFGAQLTRLVGAVIIRARTGNRQSKARLCLLGCTVRDGVILKRVKCSADMPLISNRTSPA